MAFLTTFLPSPVTWARESYKLSCWCCSNQEVVVDDKCLFCRIKVSPSFLKQFTVFGKKFKTVWGRATLPQIINQPEAMTCACMPLAKKVKEAEPYTPKYMFFLPLLLYVETKVLRFMHTQYSAKVCINEHISFAKIIHESERCGLSKCWWMIFAQVGLVPVMQFHHSTQCQKCCKVWGNVPLAYWPQERVH